MLQDDFSNKKFNKLTVISIDKKSKSGHYKWLCKCECGNTIITRGSSVKSNITKSCGCLRKEVLSKRHYLIHPRLRHGLSKTRFYRIFAGAKQRCTDKNNPSYKNYGKRGICFLWESFEQFRDDMYNSYIDHCDQFGEPDTTIERIDNNGNYSRENCVWATRSEQQRNKIR